MMGPWTTYKEKLIFPRYCMGAQQKALVLKESRRQEHQMIMTAPTVGQKRCFSLKLGGIMDLRVM